jgi:threonine dehydratase
MKLNDVNEAQKRIADVVHTTSLQRCEYFSAKAEANVFLKCEHQQKTGAFKVRGAYNKIAKLIGENKLSHVIASSAGNHAQGVAYAALKNNIKATIVMPQGTSLAKVLAVQGYGAEVVLHGKFYDDAYAHAKELEAQTGATFIHPFNDIDVIAGQGTLGVEILNQLKDADVVVCPVGGGGLIAGVAYAAKQINPAVKIVGVQAEKADAMVKSFKQNELVKLSNIYTIADGIAVKTPGDLTFEFIKQYVDEMVTVADDEIASTIIELIERTKQVVEPAGAVSLAAVLFGKTNVKNKNVVCILSGGNIDVGLMHKVIEKGLLKRGRQLELAILLQDAPGGLEKVAAIIAKTHANVIGVRYDRASAELHINDVILHITCEVSGHEHGKQIVKELKQNGFKVN